MTDFWFDRIAEYWEIPMQLDLAEHVRHTRLQVVQTQAEAPAGVCCLTGTDLSPPMLELPPDLQIPVHPVAQYNEFGREFLETLEPMFEPPWLWTDAPW